MEFLSKGSIFLPAPLFFHFMKLSNISITAGWWGLFFLLPIFGIGQQISLNDQSIEGASITLQGTWEVANPNLTAYLLLASTEATTLEFTTSALQEPHRQRVIDPSQVTLPASVSLSPGIPQEIKLVISSIPASGAYHGTLLVTATGETTPIEVPIQLNYYEKDQVKLLTTSATLSVKTTQSRWMRWCNGILPPRLRQEALTVALVNEGEVPVTFSDHSLGLFGSASGVGLNGDDLTSTGEKILDPGEITQLSFPVNTEKKLPADQYNGELRLHFEGYPDTLKVPVNLFVRIGVWGAILALILGIVLGRMMKDVEKARPQMELMDKFIPIQNKIGELKHDDVAMAQLRRELKDLEQNINQVKSSEDAAALQPELSTLDQKAGFMLDLEHLYLRVKEDVEAPGHQLPPAKLVKLLDYFHGVRDQILAGKTKAEIQQAFTNLETNINEVTAPTGSGTRSITASRNVLSGFMEEIRDRIAKSEESTENSPASLSNWERFQNWVLKVLNALSGVQVSARVRYGLFRPIVSLTLFVTLILLGFQQIYIAGGDTFGSEGIYDYLKLFLWGTISDVFSRSLVGGDFDKGQQITQFVNK